MPAFKRKDMDMMQQNDLNHMLQISFYLFVLFEFRSMTARKDDILLSHKRPYKTIIRPHKTTIARSNKAIHANLNKATLVDASQPSLRRKLITAKFLVCNFFTFCETMFIFEKMPN